MTGPATTAETRAPAPVLPGARGPVSDAVLTALRYGTAPGAVPEDVDPFGEDAQLALYVGYELHYRGFAGVADGREWDPDLLRLRRVLEERFLAAVRDATPGGTDAGGVLDALLTEYVDAYGVTHFLRDAGEWWHLREYLIHRSAYHLKEADPHAWVIPRLRGQAKASLVAVEFDEFGGGRGERLHQALFADLMRTAGLDDTYGHYLDRIPATTLATVNLMSLFGLHRGLRGALVGHFAAAEISTAPSARRMAAAMERLGADEADTVFFTEHIEADAVHEQVMRRDVVGDLLEREPELAADVVLGVQATGFLEDRMGDAMQESWRAGRGSLRA